MPDLLKAEGTPAVRHRPRAATALAAVPTGAPVSQVWAALGTAGVLRDLYDLYDHDDHDDRGGGTAAAPDPARLADLIGAVDARGDNGVTLSVLVQTASALPVLAACAPEKGPVRQALDAALSGTSTVALAATDSAAAGSDLAGLGTEVAIGPDGLLVTGGKRWITTACGADWLLVLARHRPGRHFTSFTWVLVPARAPGVRVRPADTDLLTGSATGHVELDGVRLPADHIVGRPGRGMAVFAQHMGTERLAGALWAVALTSRVLADTKERLTRRHFDGRPLWQHDAVRQRYAACLVQVRQLRALCESLGERVARRQDLAAAALLKSAAGLVADPVLAACAQLQGADGFGRGGAQRIRGEAGVLGIGGGVTELVLAAVADNADTVLTELRS
ncbi:acyl-CoA dehydrogenase family protein [Streptomyces sp. NPDC046915]|uniref:acyl-CoA dehydrogenase family protein n=1 Tax=Streptomyces sp. NPDC046915 TaxID=3155257 RepID=UPI0033D7E264